VEGKPKHYIYSFKNRYNYKIYIHFQHKIIAIIFELFNLDLHKNRSKLSSI
jgi:hypothetical protein